MLLHCAALLVLLWLESWVQCQQPQSPCPDVFKYTPDNTGLVGVIQAKPPQPTNQLVLEVKFILYGIELEKDENADSGIRLRTRDRDRGNKILNGESVEYTLSLRSGLPVPVVNQIIVNGVVTCQGEPVNSGVKSSNLWSKASFQTTGQPKPQQGKPKPRPPPVQTPPPDRVDTTELCGQVVGVNSLVFNGNPTKRGQAPWVVAMFRNAEITIDNYFCTGTLINTKYFITAAHCLKPQGEKGLPEESITVILGKFNLTRIAEGGQQILEIDRIFIHPDYEKQDNNDADLAIVKFVSTVTYSRYVQPICIKDWRLELDITGKTGMLVSWGINEEGKVNHLLEHVQLPIAGLDECRKSHISLQNGVVDRMFCAGARDNSGPCVGDSGGGLMISEEQNGEKRWYLRGIVSIGVKANTHRCNLMHFVAFTDVAKYSNWITKILDNA